MPATDRLRAALGDRYSIEREIGSGGMATVYLARDLKHDREVALKVFGGDVSAVIGNERFLAEVRITARLDHPHILTLIDSGSADGVLYYVLPYVRGESLRAKLNREKQLAVDEALSIITQVASALDYAHGQGVVHRDIKPENILLHQGEAVLADFGIALALKEASGDRLTETGLSLGTPQYMSPEQATGEHTVNRRSDVYSLGAVFYEMISGEPPVTGATARAIVAKLLTEKPVKLRVVRDTLPLAMERATDKALAKVPADRFSSAGEFARALTAASPEGERPSTRSKYLRLTAAAALVIAIAAFVAWRVTRVSGPAAIGKSSPLTLEEGLQVEPAISPNGRLVAYASGDATHMRIFIQKIAGGTPWPLSGDSARWELVPRWSPDNDELLFLSRNGAYAAPAIGGSPRLIAAGTEGDGMVRSASWSPSGDSVAIVRNDSLIVQPVQGSGSRFIGTGTQLHSCVWSPTARWIACVSGNWAALAPGLMFGNEAPSSIELYPAAGGRPIQLTDREKEHRTPTWSADGKYLWMVSNQDGVSGDVYALPIGNDGHAAGPLMRIGLQAEWLGLSRNRIAYSVRVRRANIWAIPIPADGPATLAGATQITSGNQIIELLRASRDGKWLVYDSNRRGNSDIYRMPTQGGRSERLTDDPREEYSPDLSPDNLEVMWHLWVGGERHLFVKTIDGGSAREVIPDRGDKGVVRWSPDRNAIAGHSRKTERGAVFVLHRDTQGRWHSPAWTLDDSQYPTWSPDGKTIAFVRLDGMSITTIPADSGARRTVYAARPGSSDPLARVVEWSTNPDNIWFLGHGPDGVGGIWSLSIKSGRPKHLLRFDTAPGKSNGLSFTSDGTRFFFTIEERFSNVRLAELVTR